MDKKQPERHSQQLHRTKESSLTVAGKHRYIQAATSDNTRRTYQSAIRHFEQWGGLLPADESMVICYLLDHADNHNPRTLSLRLTALRQWHRLQKFSDPTEGADVRKTLKGIERLHGQPKHKAKAFRLAHLETMITNLDGSNQLKAARDRALVLVGFFGAFRRSELAGLTVEYLTWEPEGLVVTLPRSKTDQTGEGITKALPFGEGVLCPLIALKHWLELAKIEEGPVFRGVTRWGKLKPKGLNPASINLILKSVAADAELDFASELSSHSLRRSLATCAYRSGASFESIKRQGGWINDNTVWGYIEEAQRFEDNAVASLFGKAKNKPREG